MYDEKTHVAAWTRRTRHDSRTSHKLYFSARRLALGSRLGSCNSRECPRSDAVGDVSRPFVALRFPDSSVVTTLVNKRSSFPGGHAPRRWPAVSRSVSSLVSSPARRLEGRGLESEPEPMGEPLEDLREPLAVLMREAIIMQSAAINGNQHAIRAPELQHLPRESCPQPGRGVGPAGRGFRQAVGRLVDGRAC